MALVAYDNSDSSEFEDNDNENTPVITVNKITEAPKSLEQATTSQSESQNLFNFLPQPSTKKPSVIEEDDEFLHKKEKVEPAKPKAKISVPSLSDFKDVEDRPLVTKPKTTNGKKSGLLSMLPQPKNAVTATTKSLIPHVLTQKPNQGTVKKKQPLPSPMKPKPVTLLNGYSDESDNDDNDKDQNDFFSINKPVELPEDVPLDIDEPSTNPVQPAIQSPKRKGIESYFKKEVVENQVGLEPGYAEMANAEYGKTAMNNGYGQEPNSSNGEMAIDEEAIRQLCGSRGKRKREEIQIVDVNQQEVLTEARQLLLKNLAEDTTTRVSASKRRGNEPTSQQRRKHQITFLAHQAKAKEAELQNQWANNKMSRRQTQSKYGF